MESPLPVRKCQRTEHQEMYEEDCLLYLIVVKKFQERLRTKIINRLNQEGSNADEPLNILLSDYSR